MFSERAAPMAGALDGEMNLIVWDVRARVWRVFNKWTRDDAGPFGQRKTAFQPGQGTPLSGAGIGTRAGALI
ncbi:hypothetical protein G7047_23460 [Diaphorobacter sp. HDW4A]|uniref:hypothetical protein n=1 Tax=Diaphorobacter sp. HDW4A TaxID=2714924 RepID=UPI00140CB431|nr:hypothetical protein [Diaphorobacter sp. HDW4A]QIL82565.1 hypothetical protein G7047_23460 [Diaphorobacter sp. HDW4A]